jgi:hypothetical protein
MLDMLHLLTVACLFAAAWLISRGAAYVARRPSTCGSRT